MNDKYLCDEFIEVMSEIKTIARTAFVEDFASAGGKVDTEEFARNVRALALFERSINLWGDLFEKMAFVTDKMNKVLDKAEK